MALPPGFPGYNPNLIGLKYDIEKVKLLLSQSIYGMNQLGLVLP